MTVCKSTETNDEYEWIGGLEIDDINGLSQEFASQIELDDEELKHCAKCETLSSTIEELQIELQEKDEKFEQPNREIKRFKRLENERRTIF